MKHPHKRIATTDPEHNRSVLTSRLARRVALLAIVALVVSIGLSLRADRVARGATVIEGANTLAQPASAAIQSGRKPTPVESGATTVPPDYVTGPAKQAAPQPGAKPATIINVTPAVSPTAMDNDYTRINNAVQAASSGDTIMLSGTFNWTEANAAASWALGSDGMAGTLDDYSILVPGNHNNVTFTAMTLGDAAIQGPGDLAAVNLEGVFFFDSLSGSKNQGWTISNIRFLDFDLSIGMFIDTGGAVDAFNNTKIMNNYIRIAKDLDSSVAPADDSQNIGIHFSFGTNQTISGNMIDIDGSAVRVSDAADVGMQSNSAFANFYDGLQIANNIIQVLNAQSANPELVLGIWDNCQAHTSNITISGNQFINLAGGNNPATNLQRAFRVTSHSSATSTVKYQNNSMSGAKTGFQWLAGTDFSGNQPVQLISNTMINNGTGVLIQSNGSATLSFNRIAGNTLALDNETSNSISAENNWWGCNFGPGVGGTGCAGTANGLFCSSNNSAIKGGKSAPNGFDCVDFDPWLVLRLAAMPNTILVGGTSTLTADLTFNSDSVDTHLSGNIPDGTPVTFAGNAFGTVAPSSTTTTSGKATSTYTGTAPGTGDVSTTVDMQMVTTPITVNPAPCTITCPANKTQSNDPNECGAVVTYSAPTTTGSCGTVGCNPESGSFYPVGTTTVTCSPTQDSPVSCSFTITVNDTQAPTITCANITRSTDPNQCSAIVTYPAPNVSDNCPVVGTPTCSPPSGTTFPKGTTTVSCSVRDSSNNMSMCSFTVTVNDTQPPAITCPSNIIITAAATCPPASNQTVTYTVTASDNCPGVTVVCSPASGSIFPVGTTSVTCIAMDTSGNTTSCSFTVAVFSACLVDQTNPGNVVLFNTQTGDYRFCCSGALLATGKGVLTIRGCIGTIDDQKGARKVHIGFDFSANNGHGAGTAALFLNGSTNPKCSITDQSMAGNVCTCPSGSPPDAVQK